jgi:hypothetical protein
MLNNIDDAQMSLVHEALTDVPPRFREAGYSPECIAAGFMMMALQLTADVYGKERASKLFDALSSNLKLDPEIMQASAEASSVSAKH